ncbi:hypothetical protein V7S43_013397 [Phytophthora oleae]|uniref:Uncharacterized protein n=1 Tax=Phytophthora oleae TaxID=2107226 RepID=A0ABD3F497_9STRA
MNKCLDPSSTGEPLFSETLFVARLIRMPRRCYGPNFWHFSDWNTRRRMQRSLSQRNASIAPNPTLQDIDSSDLKSPTPGLAQAAWRSTSSGIQVRPANSSGECIKPEPPKRLRPETRFRDVATGLYHWTTCLFIIALVCSQLLAAVWDSKTTMSHLFYGRDPRQGPYQIVGTNDVPYPDRVIACVKRGNYYEPKLVSLLLAAPGVSAILEDSTGTAVHGYRGLGQ